MDQQSNQQQLTAALARAVELAARGAAATSPNPAVGCVILSRDGAVVGEGWHQRAGGPHAEVLALRAAGAGAQGGTAVVTLEPCRHTGRTEPCTQALIDAGIRQVVAGVADPTPQAGGGAVELLAAGLQVDVLKDPSCVQVNRAWLTWAVHGRPYVTWKLAATLDGRSAAADGSSQWITSPQARADVQQLRARADAILVGSGTVAADNPRLTVRLPQAPARLRVVLDSQARTPLDAMVLDQSAPTVLLVNDQANPTRVAALRAAGVHVEALPGVTDENRPGAGSARIDLTAALGLLGDIGVRSLLLEGGPTLAGSLLAAGYIDEVVGYLAPAFLGAGANALLTDQIATISEISRWRFVDWAPIGPDLRVTVVAHQEA